MLKNYMQCFIGVNFRVNPLIPKSDQHLISPYNITPELHIKVMRVKKTVIREGVF